jgi:AraC-like DNA-binding protein
VSPRPIPTVSIHVVRGAFAEAIARGFEPTKLTATFGVSPEILADTDARVGADVLRRIWDELPKMLHADDFGLDVARRAAESGALGILGYVLRSASTVGEGLRSALRFQRLVTDAVRTRWVDAGDEVRVSFDDVDGAFRLPRHAVEFGLASTLLSMRAASARPLVPTRIAFRHGKPRGDSAARALFGCELSYGAPTTKIVLSRADLDVPLLSADPHLSELLRRLASGIEERLPDSASFAARVRHALHDGLARGATGLEDVAPRLGLSRRTVQRRLREEGTSHVRVLDELRRDLATRYVGEETLDLSQIAFLLGFSDQSAFHHAFVRWTGEPPGAYRRKRR